MELIDTHCHLYVEEFEDDIDDLFARAEAEGIRKFYLPAVDSTSHKRMLDLQARYPGKCIAMIGLHPCSVQENYEDELKVVTEFASQTSFAAIGEIGLDYHWDMTYKEQQVKAFREQIELAVNKDLPIVIHSRNSIDDCIQVVSDVPHLTRRGIFHCFSGTIQQAERIVELGFFLGIGGVLTYKNSGLAQVVEAIPMEHLVLETDAPYLAPVPFRGKRNESSYLKYIAGKLAEVKKITIEEVAKITTTNAQKIFGNWA